MKAKRYLNRAHKGISVFLAVVMVFSVFTGMGSFTANAAAEEAEVYMIDFPRSGDPNPGGDWGYRSLEFMNGWNSGSKTRFTEVRSMYSYEGDVCYCIDAYAAQKVQLDRR